MLRSLAFLLLIGLHAELVRAQNDFLSSGQAAFEARNWKDAYAYLARAYDAKTADRDLSQRVYVAAMNYCKELFAAKQSKEALQVAEWVQAVDPAALTDEMRFLGPYNRGQALYALGRTDDAITAFKEARTLSKNPMAARGLGLALFAKEDWAGAATAFTDLANSEQPREPGLYHHLAHALYQSGDTDKALEWLDKGLAQYPTDQMLLDMAQKYRRETKVEGGMQQSGTTNFDVKFDDTPEQSDLRTKILKALDEAYYGVTKDYSYYPDKNVPVVIYPSNDSFSSASGAPTWAAANFDGKIRIPVEAAKAADDSLRRVVTHEFTHYIVDRIGKRNVPAWVQEGLAQYQEKNDRDWASALLRRYMGNRKLKDQIFDLAKLESSFSSIQDAEMARLAYAQSLLATKYLVEKYQFYRIIQVVEALGSGSNLGDALQSTLGLDYETFQKEWLSSQATEFHLDWQ